MNSNLIKVCLVGCGWVGEEHAKAYKQLQDQGRVEFYTCDIDPDKAKLFADRYGAKSFFTNYEDVLNSSIEVVDICLPHNQHADATVLAAKAGKHILLEKPLATSLEEADRIYQAIKTSGITFMVAESIRFRPSVKTAKEFLDKNVIGEIILIQVNNIQRFVPPTWRRNRNIMGGGVLLDVGIHLADILYNLGGEIKSVYAVSNHKSILEMEGEDTGIILVKFANDAIGNMVATWGIRKPFTVPLFAVHGTEGTIYEDSGDVILVKGDKREKILEAVTDNSILEEISHFIDCIFDNKEPLVSFEIAKKDLEVILGAYMSIQSNKVISLPLEEGCLC
jgi:predicted dehydrogenase